ncbi:MAG TPA: serine hydrolase [Ktedonobacterales bacterium]|nr:serine hydrolase [Ktedonobacterales bacterium]
MTNQQLPTTETALQGLDDFVRASMEEWKGRGVALTIIKDNEVIFSQGFGVRDEARNLPVTPRTLFPIASCTKAFTTASLAILADQGKLNWDTPVRAYIPSFKLHDLFASERVTPRDLVSHRTGLPRHDLAWYHNTTATRRDFFERLQYLEPTQDLRSRWQYQNMMYMVAGYLVEVISGQTWETFVQQHLFQPLEMTSTNFDVVQTSKEADDFSHPYREVQDQVKEIPFYAAQNAIAPAGAIVSNIAEMSNWVLMHLNRGQFKGQQIVSEMQVNELHTPQMVVPPQSQYPEIPYSSYAMGWSIEPYRGYPMVDHSGGIDGFRALTTLFPREHIGIVVLSNLSQLNIPEILTYNVFERLMGLDQTPWSERFMKEHRALKDAQRQGKEQAKQKRVEGTSPSHPLEAYTGDFEHPGYGTLSITLKDGVLQGLFNDMSFPVRHYHYDIFEFGMEEVWDEVLKASFVTNVRGDIESVIVPFEPTANDIVFKRAPNRQMQDKAFLEQFVGLYKLLEMQVAVALKGEHTLSVSIEGQPDYELVPYQGNEFHAKDLSGVGIDFQRDAAGAVTGAAVTLTYGVFPMQKQG